MWHLVFIVFIFSVLAILRSQHSLSVHVHYPSFPRLSAVHLAGYGRPAGCTTDCGQSVELWNDYRIDIPFSVQVLTTLWIF